MPLTPKQRKQLSARGHHLNPAVTLGEAEPLDSAIDHVRQQFQHTDLLKVRVNTKDRAIFAAIIDDLVERIPCQLVRRIGRVALLYCPPADADST